MRCEHPLGSPENPLSRAQIEQKFRSYATGVIADAHVDAVIGAVDRLEDFGSARRLMDLLRAGPRAQAMAAAE
jgi:2-methylcitrate dehydratase PrpD